MTKGAMTDDQPRFRWLRRLILSAVAIGALLLLTWVALDQIAAARLRAHLEMLRARGEPVAPEDFPIPSAPDGNNAAATYTAAAAAMSATVDSPRQSSMEYDYELPPAEQWMEMTRLAVEANAEALRLARLAATQTRSDWGTRLTSPLINTLIPSLAPQRNLANVLADAAVYHHALGDDREAIALYRNLLHQADHLAIDPIFVSQLVAIGIEALGHHALAQFAGDIRIDDGTDGAVSRDDVRELIAELLNRPRRDIRPALQMERLWILDAYQTLYHIRYTTRPLHRADVVRSLQWTDNLIAALEAPSYAAAREQLATSPVRPVDDGTPYSASESPSSTLRPMRQMQMAERGLRPGHQIASQRNALAIALAMRLYHLDTARFPTNLEELIPAYLPEIPSDPVSGQPYQYLLFAHGRRPVLIAPGGATFDPAAPAAARFSWDWRPHSRDNGGTWYDLSAWKSGEPRLWIGYDDGASSFEEGDEDPDHPDGKGQPED